MWVTRFHFNRLLKTVGYIAMWVTLLLILKDVLSRFAFRYQNVFYFEFVEKGLKFVNQSEIVGYTV